MARKPTRTQLARLAEEQAIALRLGFETFEAYIRERRAAGWGYQRLAKETGRTREWVRGSLRRLEPRGSGGVGSAG